MKIQPYVTKLNGSPAFKSFQKEYKDAFMVAGFFILDLEEGKNVHQIDYYVPSKKKVAAFTLDNRVTMQMLDMMNSKAPEKLDLGTNMDLDQIPGILEDEMKNRNITEAIKKVIAIIQNLDGKKIWNLSCVLSGMGILNAHIEDSSKTVLKMEKKNLLDFIQKVNPADLKSNISLAKDSKEISTKDVASQIKKLDELEQAIEKQKEELEKQSNKQPLKTQKNVKASNKK